MHRGIHRTCDVTRSMKRYCRLLAVSMIPILLALGATSVLHAEDFPPITDAEWELTKVPWAPEADAVVVFRSAEMWMRGDDKLSSALRIRQRVKILDREGWRRLSRGPSPEEHQEMMEEWIEARMEVEQHGEVFIYHSGWTRLSGFQGRTVKLQLRSCSPRLGTRPLARSSAARISMWSGTRATFRPWCWLPSEACVRGI